MQAFGTIHLTYDIIAHTMSIQNVISDFSDLDPDLIMKTVEEHCSVFLDGSLTPYNSYINRVFGVKDDDETDYIVKFYRKERWSKEAIADEHRFLLDCKNDEIPVISPIADRKGNTIGSAAGYLCAVFPRLRARTFDIYGETDWIRIGSLIGRLHTSAQKNTAPARLTCTPEATTATYIDLFLTNNLVHPEIQNEFEDICAQSLELISPLFANLPFHRVHGDCHRGNILENRDKELTLIDFDDMMIGPAIQDLWLLLPGHLEDSRKEMNLILEGYEQFCTFNRETLILVEPLRFMRQIYFLSWQAMQRNDSGFLEKNPDWGTKAFWMTETEDLKTQLIHISKIL